MKFETLIMPSLHKYELLRSLSNRLENWEEKKGCIETISSILEL